MNNNIIYDSIIGKSNVIRELFSLVEIVSQSSANVFIHGESGTGKELVARALHSLSQRNNNSFIAVNCSAIPDNLLESELFGHVKGSFTGATTDKKGLFEEADGGVLFLDEIGDLNLPLQAKLLRVLQNKEVRAVGGNRNKKIDARIISATHHDLKKLVKKDLFREDLYYRLNVIPIRVPALRNRKEDIPLLIEHFINKYCIKNNISPFHFSNDEMERLISYDWPGNIRELENVIERLVVLRCNENLEKAIFEESINEETDLEESHFIEDRPTLEKLEERYIKTVLNEVHNQKNKAAQILGISRRTLHRKEIVYGMFELSSN